MSNIGVGLRDAHAETINIREVKVGLIAEELVAALESRGALQTSKLAGLQLRTIVSFAHRLKRPRFTDSLCVGRACVYFEAACIARIARVSYQETVSRRRATSSRPPGCRCLERHGFAENLGG
jgi:hypothetical protein